MADRYRDRWRWTERVRETESETERFREYETVSQTGSDTDKAGERVRKRDAKRVSCMSEVRIPKEAGRNRVSPRKTDKETKKEDNQTQNPHRDKQTLKKSWKMEKDEKGRQQRSQHRRAPPRAVCPGNSMWGWCMYWNVFVHTFACDR